MIGIAPAPDQPLACHPPPTTGPAGLPWQGNQDLLWHILLESWEVILSDRSRGANGVAQLLGKVDRQDFSIPHESVVDVAAAVFL